MHDDNTFYAAAAKLEQQCGDPSDEQQFINFKTSSLLDETQQFPTAYIEYLQQLGYFEYFVPSEQGGQLKSFAQLLLICRALSRRDLNAAIATGQTMLGALPVWLCGSSAQKNQLASHILQGHLGCLALTEKRHGSNLLASEVSATATATGYELSGEKWLINNATKGHTMTLLARKQETSGRSELALLFIDKTNLTEFENLDKINTHGIRCADISGIRFNNTEVASDVVIKTAEPGIYGVMKALQISRILCAGFSLGALDTCLRTTYQFAQSRVLYQRPMLSMPTVSQGLARSFARLLLTEIAALVCSKAIAYAAPSLSVYSAFCKYWVPRQAEIAIDELKVILGARYYLRDEHQFGIFQKMLRDNAVVSLFDGSSQVNLALIATQTNALASKLLAAQETVHDVAKWFSLTSDQASSAIQADELKLNNLGQDPILASFIAVCDSNLITTQSDRMRALYVELKQRILRWCDEIITLKEQELNDPSSVVRFAKAKQYTQLLAATCCALTIIHNPSHLLLSNDDISNDLMSLLLNDTDQWQPCEALLQALAQQFETQKWFSLLPI
ncbi:acyl-CoA dehydrogenase family protein [Pseudoalteromonas tunicata]|uniref:acyl-CoA dehydrogenase family protein n=1 Tax=Pseudoalteromonas tunicata TaxID=314281 RepID=UPI00274021BE|nr:acyl-CoA dehydrogenase family protein [Pseudoalteromonas tunicata]MDP4982064.1 acyl-CoA dehydrogenase family protein [Pseudoalteromonas tunicata]